MQMTSDNGRDQAAIRLCNAAFRTELENHQVRRLSLEEFTPAQINRLSLQGAERFVLHDRQPLQQQGRQL